MITRPPGLGATRRGWGAWKPLDGYTVRVVAAIHLVSIPPSVVFGFVMANRSAHTSIDQAEPTAEGGAIRITGRVSEQQAELRSITQLKSDQLSQTCVPARLQAAVGAPYFETITIFDTAAGLIASLLKNAAPVSTIPTGATFAHSLSVETIGPATPDSKGL